MKKSIKSEFTVCTKSNPRFFYFPATQSRLRFRYQIRNFAFPEVVNSSWRKSCLSKVLLMSFLGLFLSFLSIRTEANPNRSGSRSRVSNASQGQHSPGYCLALRGNGELIPAHWGALASTLETWGLPMRTAGSSSASLSLFMLSQIAQNPFVKQALNQGDPYLAGDRAAQILKLVAPALQVVVRTKMAALEIDKDLLFQLKDSFRKMKEQWLASEKSATPVSDYKTFLTSLKHYLRTMKLQVPLAFGPAVQELEDEASGQLSFFDGQKGFVNAGDFKTKRVRLRNRIESILSGIQVFGKFDAQSDKGLFLRSGLLNFDVLILGWAKLAGFFRQFQANEQDQAFFNQVIEACGVSDATAMSDDLYSSSSDSSNFGSSDKGGSLNFSQIPRSKGYLTLRKVLPNENSNCQNILSQALKTYLSQDHSTADLLDESFDAPDSIQTFVSTSIVLGSSALRFRKLKEDYHNSGEDFLDTSESQNILNGSGDLKFGYFGPEQFLNHLSVSSSSGSLGPVRNLQGGRKIDLSRNAKVKLFYPLKGYTWKTALALSAAEPGLSSGKLVPVSNSKTEMWSLGGWSDLHPVEILSLSGCRRTVYVTRRGGEAKFAQGVAKRLWKWSLPEWTYFKEKIQFPDRKDPVDRNDWGQAEDQDSPWSQLYNLQNKSSSFSQALELSSAVVCTDWNQYKLMNDGPLKIFQKAYEAPILMKNDWLLSGRNLRPAEIHPLIFNLLRWQENSAATFESPSLKQVSLKWRVQGANFLDPKDAVSGCLPYPDL